jgi:hypothetical protein
MKQDALGLGWNTLLDQVRASSMYLLCLRMQERMLERMREPKFSLRNEVHELLCGSLGRRGR